MDQTYMDPLFLVHKLRKQGENMCKRGVRPHRLLARPTSKNSLQGDFGTGLVHQACVKCVQG